MPRVISFSEVDFVRKILQKTKNQTIRPIKYICCQCGKVRNENKIPIRKRYKCEHCGIISPMILKQPIHKVGDTVKLSYKSRGYPKDTWFCDGCGVPYVLGTDVNKPQEYSPQLCCHKKTNLFPKHFATAKIVEVFQIELIRYDICKNGKPLNFEDKEEIAVRDGFNTPSLENLYSWFDKRYDLSVPRRFAVYRFEVI